MFLSGVNFSLQYRVVVQRQIKALLQNAEFFFYLWVFLGISSILTIVLIFHNHYEYFTALRDALFQTISVLTTAGFASVNFDNWTNSAKLLLFALMLIGGSAGSASGGIKSVRILIVLKYLWREITLILHPNAIIPLKLGKLTVSNEVLRQIIGFILFYFIILIVSSLLVSALESDMLIGVVGSTATLGNVGPGFAQIGPMGSFESLRVPTKIIFIFNMIVGRLELIPFLAMLHLGFWKFKK
jgi:trk system potassium uptake protein TrkH